MKTSDAEKAVRFEARKWREAITGTREERQPDYSFKEVEVEYPAEWAVYGVKSGVRVKYCSTNREAAEAYAAKWNSGKVPAEIDAKDESAAYLKTILKPGDTVNTILRSCSRSGMSRRISLVIARDSEVVDISWHAARAMGEKVKQGGQYVQDAGIVVGGCGMDMGFSLVYNLSRSLWPDGFGYPVAHDPECSATQYRPETKEHAQKPLNRGVTFLHGRNRDTSGWDEDGGYALEHRWL
jgi:hypothetical protein